ncbi:hypothetical protein WJX84_004937 [Apatococcus fuscideae]|uniref:rRNA biogenesis protein RRP36 n=1 Tax=Apatococcus fuscideae TaxID=2026836 RepID=A0AAW1T4M8_9CHLO
MLGKRKLSEAESDSGSEPEEADLNRQESDDSGTESPAVGQDVPFEVFLKRLEAQQGQGVQSGLPHKHKNPTHLLQPEPPVEVAKPKRENKNRPVEASAKRPVKRHREVIEGLGRRSRDPRFDQQRTEYQGCPEEGKGGGQKKLLQGQLTRVEQTLRAEESRRAEQQQARLEQAAEKEAVKGGKRPYFAKKTDRKQQDLVRKYQALKATGRLEKVMEKRRRKNASSDHRYIPGGRRSQD